MKPTQFYWTWNDRPEQPDALMTRERASRLLRAWRHTRAPNRDGYTPRTLQRIAPHTYRVHQNGYGESATMRIATN